MLEQAATNPVFAYLLFWVSTEKQGSFHDVLSRLPGVMNISTNGGKQAVRVAVQAADSMELSKLIGDVITSAENWDMSFQRFRAKYD
jgi:hypothetical protein